MASQYDPTTFGWQNFYSAVLQSDITSGSLTLSLDTVPSSTAGILVIEPDSATNREVILYTSKGASTITCPSDGRGWASSTAVAHLTGSAVIMADVSSFFKGLGDGTLSSDPLRTTLFFDHIVSGGVVAQSAGLIGTFSDIIFYLNGRRYSGSSIANKTYTASKDTYVDITGNSDGSVTVLYTEVSNNAASPALTTNYIRVAIVTTSGAAITNVNQGQENQVIPIASSTAYSVTDSLGNLICPRDPERQLLGYRQVTAGQSGVTTEVDLTGLSAPVIVPSGRKIKITYHGNHDSSDGTSPPFLHIKEGSTFLNTAGVANAGGYKLGHVEYVGTPTAGSHTYKISMIRRSGAGTVSLEANAAAGSTPGPAFIKVELQ